MARAEVMEAEKVARKENEEKACRREDGEVVDDVEGREREEKREAGWRGTADGRQKEEGGCSCSNDVVALSGLFPSGGFSVSFGDFGCRLRMEGTTALLHCTAAGTGRKRKERREAPHCTCRVNGTHLLPWTVP